MRFSAKEKTHWKTTLFRPTCTSWVQRAKAAKTLVTWNFFELVDISPSQQLLHTGKVSIEHWNMAPMDWVGILGQKYWINLQTKDLKYFNTDIFVRSNGTSTERLLVAFTLYHSGNAEIYQVFSISKILVDHQNWNMTKIFIIINTRINLINTITNTLTLKCCL